MKVYEIDHCHPHSISVVSDSTIFLGCSTAHGPSPKPGGDMAIFDIATGKVVAYGADLGGSATRWSITNSATTTMLPPPAGRLMVIDIKTRKLLQKIPTSNGARSLGVSLANNRVYLATTAKELACGGCIVVYAPE